MQFLTEHEPPRGVALPVRPGISRVVAPNPGPMTYWGTNTYLIDLPEGVFVLDPGPDDPGHVARVLEAAGPIAGILISHTHHDHVGALRALRAATGAPVYAWHAPADPAVAPDIPLRDGDRVGPLEVVFTPGHAADHLCFALPDGVTFSADHIMGWSTTVVGPPGGNMAAYFASLQRMLERPAELYLPGHGPGLAPPLPFVAGLLRHRQEREAAIHAALDALPRSVRDLAQLIYPDLGDSLRRAAERNVGAHLVKLAAEGRAADVGGGWIGQ